MTKLGKYTRVSNLRGCPPLSRCFAAIGFDWRMHLAEHGCRHVLKPRYRKGSFVSLPSRAKAGTIRQIFQDSVTASAVLWDARHRWLERAQALHPDRNGDGPAMAQVNLAWTRIKELFARRGICL